MTDVIDRRTVRERAGLQSGHHRPGRRLRRPSDHGGPRRLHGAVPAGPHAGPHDRRRRARHRRPAPGGLLDSTGLGVLVGGLKRFREHGGSLAPVVTKTSILKIFQITGLTSVLPPRSSVADAIDIDPHWRQAAEAKAAVRPSGAGSTIWRELPRPRLGSRALSHCRGRFRQTGVTATTARRSPCRHASTTTAARSGRSSRSTSTRPAAPSNPSLPAETAFLCMIRASQINGCSVCTDMHTKDAVHAGETSARLNLVAAWRDATVFTDAERAALELTEQGTRIADAGGVTNEVWANAAKHYDDDQLAGLVSLIAVINAYNRLNVIVRQPAGDYQPGQWSWTVRPCGPARGVIAASEASVRGRPKCGARPLSMKRVIAEIRSPSMVSTMMPCRCEIWARGVGHVAAERGLAVRPGRDQPGAPAAAVARALRQEARDRGRTLVLQVGGRHAEPGVVGEQRHHAVDVVVGVRGGEPLRQLPFPRGPGQRGAFAIPARAAPPSSWPGPAAARCSPTPRWCRACPRPPGSGSRARRAAAGPRAAAAAGAGRRRRTPARSSPWPRRPRPGRRRCRAGRRAARPGTAGARPARRGGSGAGASNGGSGGSGRGRRPLSRSAFRQRLVAIRYSQVRSPARPSYWPRPRQAASRVSCSTSSASWTEPRIR